MRIKQIKIGKVRIPLKTPFKTALREVDTAEDIVVKVIADTGEIGWGNAPATVVSRHAPALPLRPRCSSMASRCIGWGMPGRPTVVARPVTPACWRRAAPVCLPKVRPSGASAIRWPVVRAWPKGHPMSMQGNQRCSDSMPKPASPWLASTICVKASATS